MSLFAGFLRDGLLASFLDKPRKSVLIAIRSDSLSGAEILGDGTQLNPYDGSTAAKSTEAGVNP